MNLLNMKPHHIGIIVKNSEKSTYLYLCLGYKKIKEPIYDNIQNNKITLMLDQDGTQMLELIEPLNNKSSIYNFNEGYHHICYEGNDSKIESLIENFKKLKIGKIFTQPIKAPAFDNRKILFAYLYNGLLIEFIL